MTKESPITERVLFALLGSSLLSILLLVLRMVAAGNYRFNFMIWNLFLAWLPLLFAIWLWDNMLEKHWLSWQNVLLTLLWVSFLPNSFYMMSDLIHLQNSSETTLLYDAAMLMSFILNGLLLGYMSVHMVHSQFRKRFRPVTAHTLIGLVFLSSSFAIYLGRYLRWNTWDIVFHPAALIFDITDSFINPLFHLQAFLVTGVFFLLIGGFYIAGYRLLTPRRPKLPH